MIATVACINKEIKYSDITEIEWLVNSSIDMFLKKGNYQTLKELILPGSKVVIKPNLVTDKNNNNKVGPTELDCLITNWNIIFTLLKRLNEVPNLKIVIAECPMQWCDLNKIVTESVKRTLTNIYKYSSVEFKDLRAYKYIKNKNNKLKEIEKVDKLESINVHLDDSSMFFLTNSKIDKLRIMDYPLEGLKKYHTFKKHIYNFDSVYLECDYIISVPKLKTHMKAGMTGAMKNLVGTVSDKECIPHHTKGSKSSNGDCYEKFAFDKALGEYLYDCAYQCLRKYPQIYELLKGITNKGILKLRRSLNLNDNISGSWYGNITLPKSIIDINRAMIYGGLDGKLHKTPQRTLLTLMDCVLIGEENGPLAPSPKSMNTIIFSDSCMLADKVAATLLGFSIDKIHYLNKSFIKGDFSLESGIASIIYNYIELEDIKTLENYAIKVKPPKYWVGHIENTNQFL